jgi:hypothetical protein
VRRNGDVDQKFWHQFIKNSLRGETILIHIEVAMEVVTSKKTADQLSPQGAKEK